MEEFRLYKFVFNTSTTIDSNWLQSETAEKTDLSKAQDTFDKILLDAMKGDRRLPIGKEPQTGDKVLPNSILRIENHVIILKIHNPGTVDIWPLNGGKTTEDTYPYLYIIIDNRPGVGQLAVQMGTEAWKDPDTITKLLGDNLNRILSDEGTGLQIEIRQKYLPTEFFDFVKDKKKKEKATVSHIYFEITNPEFEAPIDTAVETSGHIRYMLKMLMQLGGAKALFKVDAPKNNELIRKKLKDIKQMVSLVATNGYSLKVDFSDKTKYSCNDIMLHDDTMKETILSDFIDGQKHDLFDFELFHWLDEMIKKEKDYGYNEKPLRVKPARKNKRKVS